MSIWLPLILEQTSLTPFVKVPHASLSSPISLLPSPKIELIKENLSDYILRYGSAVTTSVDIECEIIFK